MVKLETFTSILQVYYTDALIIILAYNISEDCFTFRCQDRKCKVRIRLDLTQNYTKDKIEKEIQYFKLKEDIIYWKQADDKVEHTCAGIADNNKEKRSKVVSALRKDPQVVKGVRCFTYATNGSSDPNRSAQSKFKSLFSGNRKRIIQSPKS